MPHPYRVIRRTALYWNEQQRMLVSLSCHIIISLHDCWSCTACCRCYQLPYQISAAALYNVLNRSPVQCNVEAAHVFTMFMCLLIYLPPPYPSIFCILLGCYDLLRSHCCWTKCTSAKSTNLFSGPYYCIHVHVCPVYTYPALDSHWKTGIHDLNRVITESALYWSVL